MKRQKVKIFGLRKKMMNIIDTIGYVCNYQPCYCCGMTYTPKPRSKTVKTAGKGIRVLYGKVDEPREAGNITVSHVNTKNGVLTVVNKSLP
jgi:hypothetical protein